MPKKLKKDPKKCVQELLDFIDASPTPWHVCHNIAQELEKNGFTKLEESDSWSLAAEGNYYVVRDETSIVSFSIGSETDIAEVGFRIIGSHTDSPTLRIKPNPVKVKSDTVLLGVETYGGAILPTFADRDLSLAGRVICKSDDNWLGATSRLVSFEKPILRIPNLAIHMNREVNEKGLKLDKYNELSPILAVIQNELPKQDIFKEMVADKIGVAEDEILSWEFSVFDTQKGSFFGRDDEFIAASRIDNLASVHASLEAMIESLKTSSNCVNVCAFFDHEEIGSSSAKGACSTFLSDVLERISAGFNDNGESHKRAISNSILVSSDMTHAYLPGFGKYYDDENKVMVNQGPAIKINANHRYSTEGISEAFFINICEKAGVPFQRYVHRADLPCGSTIGPLVASAIGIRSIDIGNPMWSMHSIRESAGTIDHKYLIDCFKTFFDN